MIHITTAERTKLTGNQYADTIALAVDMIAAAGQVAHSGFVENYKVGDLFFLTIANRSESKIEVFQCTKGKKGRGESLGELHSHRGLPKGVSQEAAVEALQSFAEKAGRVIDDWLREKRRVGFELRIFI